MKIPKSFKLFNTTFKVVFDDEYCNNKSVYGETSYSSASITLSTTENEKFVDVFGKLLRQSIETAEF